MATVAFVVHHDIYGGSQHNNGNWYRLTKLEFRPITLVGGNGGHKVSAAYLLSAAPFEKRDYGNIEEWAAHPSRRMQ